MYDIDNIAHVLFHKHILTYRCTRGFFSRVLGFKFCLESRSGDGGPTGPCGAEAAGDPAAVWAGRGTGGREASLEVQDLKQVNGRGPKPFWLIPCLVGLGEFTTPC